MKEFHEFKRALVVNDEATARLKHAQSEYSAAQSRAHDETTAARAEFVRALIADLGENEAHNILAVLKGALGQRS